MRCAHFVCLERRRTCRLVHLTSGAVAGEIEDEAVVVLADVAVDVFDILGEDVAERLAGDVQMQVDLVGCVRSRTNTKAQGDFFTLETN